MGKKRILTISSTILMAFLIVLVLGNLFIFSQEDGLRSQEQIDQLENFIELDFTNINEIVDDVLEAYPAVNLEIHNVKSKSMNEFHHELNNESVTNLLDIEKRAFRLEVNSRLTNQSSTTDLNRVAEDYTNKDLEALRIAESVYNVVITQDEVTSFIDQNVFPIVTEEKEAYAKALGLTLEQLDYIFDRDIYVMDALWERLIPVLIDEYPQEDDETSNNYQERLKGNIL